MNQKEEFEIYFVNNEAISHFSPWVRMFKMLWNQSTFFTNSYDPGKILFSDFFFFLHLILNDKIIVFEKDRMEKGKELLPLTSKTLELTLFISVLVYCFIFLIKNCMVFSFSFRTDTLGKHLQLMWFSLMHWWVLTFQFSKLLFYDLKHFLLTTHVQ